MNWAYKAIAHTPGTEAVIAAPLVVRNQFYDSNFRFLHSPWQWQHPADEWSFSITQRAVARVFRERYWRYVFDRMEGEKPAAVHAHFAQVGCAVMDQANRKKWPLVTSFYGADYERLPFLRPRYVDLYRRLFETASAVLCEGEHGASVLIKMGCPAGKIHIVPLGIEPQKVPFVRRNKQAGQLRLLQAATIVAKKGHLDTLEAFRLALPDCPGLRLTLVGEKVDKVIVGKMRDFIARNRLESSVEWLDFVDTRRFYAFIEGFDVFIHPSCHAPDRDCEGGAPIVLLDAGAGGLPVIATRHCDIPAEVLHDRTGLLAPEGDVATLAAHIRRFYAMENAEYMAFCLNSRQHVEQHFNVKKTGEMLREVYESLKMNKF